MRGLKLITENYVFSEYPLSDRLLKALEQLSIEKPTEVQAQTLPPALEGKDLLVAAETGSGKTLAFLVPLLQRCIDESKPSAGTRGLILTPTRELAEQVAKMCEALAAFTQIKVQTVCGGENWSNQSARLRKNPEILVGTPGRLKEHLERNSLDFDDLEYLVLDEADRMLDMGFRDEVTFITERCNSERQTLLLSATLSNANIGSLIRTVLKKPVKLQLSTAQDAVESIKQQIILADNPAHKEKLLNWLLENESYAKAVVFCNTRAYAELLADKLNRTELRTGLLHGELEQPERNRIMKLLREGKINILVATDVAARGLDIEGIDLVINFDMARKGDEHVHRIGRTGRQGRDGLAICLIQQNEWNLMASIQRYLKIKFEQRVLPGLAGHYKGPERLKSNGKSVGKKRPKSSRDDKSNKAKPKKRARDQKDLGKRRAPLRAPSGGASLGDGSMPFGKKKPAAD